MLGLLVRPFLTHGPRQGSRGADMQTAWVAVLVPHVHDDGKRLDGSSVALSYMSASVSMFPVVATHGRGCSGNGPLSPDTRSSFSNSTTWLPPLTPLQTMPRLTLCLIHLLQF